jgi:hypothetical protein
VREKNVLEVPNSGAIARSDTSKRAIQVEMNIAADDT